MRAIVLDPTEVATNRAELDLESGSIQVAEAGIDWGNAEIAAYMAEAELGSVPVDFRIPNRIVTIPLLLIPQGATSFGEARSALQQKVALFQREGGWLKYESAEGPGYLDVVNASLTYGRGKTIVLGDGSDADVVLTLECIPDTYGDEVTGSDHVETTAAELIFTETSVPGDHPGRVRIVVDEDDGDSQLGLIWGIRSRHYSSAATAALAYQAEALTPLDTAATAGLSGASGTVMKHSDLSTSWTPVMNTNLLAGTYLTHTGTYRVFARVYSPDTVVKLRFVWDVGDILFPVENEEWEIPGASNFYIADLGEIRLDQVPTGTHRWQGQIQAKGDDGGEDVNIDKLWFCPVDEGFGILRAPPRLSEGLATYSARDEFNQSAGALAGKTLPIGGTWAGAGDATDFALDTTAHTAQRTAVSDAAGIATARLMTANGTASMTNTAVQVHFSHAVAALATGGVIARYTDTSNLLYAACSNDSGPETGEYLVVKVVAGSSTLLVPQVYGVPWAAQSDKQGIALTVLSDGTWAMFGGPTSSTLALLAAGRDSALASGGALASGRVGMLDQQVSATANTREYDKFGGWVPTPEAVLHASQSAELSTNGHFREDSAGVAYGPVSHVVGDLPRIPPSGSEGRTVEFVIKGSRGNFDQIPDSGIDDISAVVKRRSSHLFVPEN